MSSISSSSSSSSETSLIPFYPSIEDDKEPDNYSSGIYKTIYHDLMHGHEQSIVNHFNRYPQYFGRVFTVINKTREFTTTFLQLACRTGLERIVDLIATRFPKLLDFSSKGSFHRFENLSGTPLEYVIRETEDSVSARVVPFLIKTIDYEFKQHYIYISGKPIYTSYTSGTSQPFSSKIDISKLNDKEIQDRLTEPGFFMIHQVTRNGIKVSSLENFIFQTIAKGKILTFKSILKFYSEKVIVPIEECAKIPKAVASLILDYQGIMQDIITLRCEENYQVGTTYRMNILRFYEKLNFQTLLQQSFYGLRNYQTRYLGNTRPFAELAKLILSRDNSAASFPYFQSLVEGEACVNDSMQRVFEWDKERYDSLDRRSRQYRLPPGFFDRLKTEEDLDKLAKELADLSY